MSMLRNRKNFPTGRDGTVEYHKDRAKWHTDQAAACERMGKMLTPTEKIVADLWNLVRECDGFSSDPTMSWPGIRGIIRSKAKSVGLREVDLDKMTDAWLNE